MDLVKKLASDYTEFLNLDYIDACISLGFSENGCFANKKGKEKLA